MNLNFCDTCFRPASALPPQQFGVSSSAAFPKCLQRIDDASWTANTKQWGAKPALMGHCMRDVFDPDVIWIRRYRMEVDAESHETRTFLHQLRIGGKLQVFRWMRSQPEWLPDPIEGGPR